MATCPVCAGGSNNGTPFDGGMRKHVSCLGCGDFVITESAEKVLKDSFNKIAVVSRWIRRQCDAGQTPQIDQANLSKIVSENLPLSVAEQADRLILWLGEKLLTIGTPDGNISLSEHRLIAATVGAAPRSGGEGLLYLIRESQARGLISPFAEQQFGLTFKGWERYEALNRKPLDSRIALMAMPFGDKLLDKVFAECFRPAVTAAGFDLRRLDTHPKAGNIDDRLRVEIRGARFLIAELTGANPGAYWEAGFAEGLGKPVIYTCEKSCFDDPGRKPHFDTNHHLTVIWHESTLPKAAEELKATIRETLPTEAK